MSQTTEKGVRGRARAWERAGTSKDLVGPVGAGQGLRWGWRRLYFLTLFFLPIPHPDPPPPPHLGPLS